MQKALPSCVSDTDFSSDRLQVCSQDGGQIWRAAQRQCLTPFDVTNITRSLPGQVLGLEGKDKFGNDIYKILLLVPIELYGIRRGNEQTVVMSILAYAPDELPPGFSLPSRNNPATFTHRNRLVGVRFFQSGKVNFGVRLLPNTKGLAEFTYPLFLIQPEPYTEALAREFTKEELLDGFVARDERFGLQRPLTALQKLFKGRRADNPQVRFETIFDVSIPGSARQVQSSAGSGRRQPTLIEDAAWIQGSEDGLGVLQIAGELPSPVNSTVSLIEAIRRARMPFSSNLSLSIASPFDRLNYLASELSVILSILLTNPESDQYSISINRITPGDLLDMSDRNLRQVLGRVQRVRQTQTRGSELALSVGDYIELLSVLAPTEFLQSKSKEELRECTVRAVSVWQQMFRERGSIVPTLLQTFLECPTAAKPAATPAAAAAATAPASTPAAAPTPSASIVPTEEVEEFNAALIVKAPIPTPVVRLPPATITTAPATAPAATPSITPAPEATLVKIPILPSLFELSPSSPVAATSPLDVNVFLDTLFTVETPAQVVILRPEKDNLTLGASLNSDYVNNVSSIINARFTTMDARAFYIEFLKSVLEYVVNRNTSPKIPVVDLNETNLQTILRTSLSKNNTVDTTFLQGTIQSTPDTIPQKRLRNALVFYNAAFLIYANGFSIELKELRNAVTALNLDENKRKTAYEWIEVLRKSFNEGLNPTAARVEEAANSKYAVMGPLRMYQQEGGKFLYLELVRPLPSSIEKTNYTTTRDSLFLDDLRFGLMSLHLKSEIDGEEFADIVGQSGPSASSGRARKRRHVDTFESWLDEDDEDDDDNDDDEDNDEDEDESVSD